MKEFSWMYCDLFTKWNNQMSLYQSWDFRAASWKKEEEAVDVYMKKSIISTDGGI